MEHEVTPLLDELVRRWEAEDVPWGPANSVEQVRAFEARTGVSLPEDMSRYFLSVGGMQENCTDGDLFCFWSLAEVGPVESDSVINAAAYAGYYLFADFMIWSHAYGVRLAGDASHPVVIVGGEAPIQVAESFTDFLRKYLRDPEALY